MMMPPGNFFPALAWTALSMVLARSLSLIVFALVVATVRAPPNLVGPEYLWNGQAAQHFMLATHHCQRKTSYSLIAKSCWMKDRKSGQRLATFRQ
jgi:hypothetical protein